MLPYDQHPSTRSLTRGIAGAAVESACVSLGDGGESWIGAVSAILGASSLTGPRCALQSVCPDSRSVLPEAGFSVVADAEIHNRRDLLARLGSRQLDPYCSDTELILAAYQKWGVNCPDFLLGEFSFAVWDQSRARLFCCRDHMATRPFFYWTDGCRFVFSSDVLCLFAFPGVDRELNKTRLASWALNGAASTDHEQTFFQGVLSLPSATTLCFEKGRISKRCYWKPSPQAVKVPSRDQEAFEALRELLFEAVACRVDRRVNVAACLSGGLDSSSLVSIAARHLEKKNRTVVALAAVLPERSKPGFTDEREFIDEFRGFPNVELEYIAPPEDGGPFDGIEDPSLFEELPWRYSRYYLVEAMQQAAARRRADVILDGVYGEVGPSCAPHAYSLELAARLKWFTLARHLFLLHARRYSVSRILWRDIRSLFSLNRRTEPLYLFAPDFRRRWEDVLLQPVHWPDHRLLQRLTIQAYMDKHQFSATMFEPGIPVSQPFVDKRVLEFCLAAPGRLKTRHGYERYLIRGAMEGVLPKKIQWRTSKCAFSPDYPRRYREQLPKARDFVAAIRRNDPVRSVVDIDRLRYLLDHPLDTPVAGIMQLVKIPATIYLICFLRQFAEFRP